MNDWNGRRVLVTGAEGFIGSTLVERLVSAGAKVRAFVHYKPYGENNHLADVRDDIEVFPGDLRDAGRVEQVVDGSDVVFHLGALIGVPYSFQAPESYLQTNVMGTHNVLAACSRHNARLIHMSSSEVYGSAMTVPIREDHPLRARSPYSASKVSADLVAQSYWHSFALPVTIARPFNTYGPRQSPRAVIASILGQLHDGATEIQIGSLTATRDFTYVTDTVAGLMALAESEATLGKAVNIGSGTEVSIGRLASMLIEITGSDASVVTTADRMRPSGSEVDRLRCDNSRIRRLTGWKPEVSLEDGLNLTSEWIGRGRRASSPLYLV